MVRASPPAEGGDREDRALGEFPTEAALEVAQAWLESKGRGMGKVLTIEQACRHCIKVIRPHKPSEECVGDAEGISAGASTARRSVRSRSTGWSNGHLA
jgi:hypothetical protein